MIASLACQPCWKPVACFIYKRFHVGRFLFFHRRSKQCVPSLKLKTFASPPPPMLYIVAGIAFLYVLYLFPSGDIYPIKDFEKQDICILRFCPYNYTYTYYLPKRYNTVSITQSLLCYFCGG